MMNMKKHNDRTGGNAMNERERLAQLPQEALDVFALLRHKKGIITQNEKDALKRLFDKADVQRAENVETESVTLLRHKKGVITQNEKDALRHLFDKADAQRAEKEKTGSVAVRFSAWRSEALKKLAEERQEAMRKISFAAASKDEIDEKASRGNISDSFHLENKEEGIKLDIDLVDEKTLEVIIQSEKEIPLKTLEVLSDDGKRTELGEIEENSYAKIDLSELYGKLVITTEEDKLIVLK